MGNTNRDNIVAIAPELSKISKELFDLVLADLANTVGSNYGARQEQAQRYLGAHTLTLLNPESGSNPDAVGGIKSERNEEVQIQYDGLSGLTDKNRLDTTKYGVMFNQITKQSVVPFMGIRPSI
jgi:hypothetical protein